MTRPRSNLAPPGSDTFSAPCDAWESTAPHVRMDNGRRIFIGALGPLIEDDPGIRMYADRKGVQLERKQKAYAVRDVSGATHYLDANSVRQWSEAVGVTLQSDGKRLTSTEVQNALGTLNVNAALEPAMLVPSQKTPTDLPREVSPNERQWSTNTRTSMKAMKPYLREGESYEALEAVVCHIQCASSPTPATFPGIVDAFLDHNVPQAAKRRALQDMLTTCGTATCDAGLTQKLQGILAQLRAGISCEEFQIRAALQDLKTNIITQIATDCDTITTSNGGLYDSAGESVHYVSAFLAALGDRIGMTAPDDPNASMFEHAFDDEEYQAKVLSLFEPAYCASAMIEQCYEAVNGDKDPYGVTTHLGRWRTTLSDIMQHLTGFRDLPPDAREEFLNTFFEVDPEQGYPTGLNREGVALVLREMGMLIPRSN